MSRSGQKGFTLIEVLVAFSVLSLTLTLLYQANTESLARQGDLRTEARALGLAQNILARVGHDVPLKEEEFSGVEDNVFRWVVTIKRENDSSSSTDFQLYRVRAEVTSLQTGDVDALEAVRFGPSQREDE